MILNATDNLFLVTSCLNAKRGIYNVEQRYNQTLETIDSIRKIPNSKIILFDSSKIDNQSILVKDLEKRVEFVGIISNETLDYFTDKGMNSPAEAQLMYLMLCWLKSQSPLLYAQRIFKISGRYKLTTLFDVNFHVENHFGKFVFKEAISSWKNDGTFLYPTCLFSFCPSLISYYIEQLPKIFNSCANEWMDYEHATWKHIKSHVIETSPIGVEGNIAPNGEYINE